jgi:hypothetical protein
MDAQPTPSVMMKWRTEWLRFVIESLMEMQPEQRTVVLRFARLSIGDDPYITRVEGQCNRRRMNRRA